MNKDSFQDKVQEIFQETERKKKKKKKNGLEFRRFL